MGTLGFRETVGPLDTICPVRGCGPSPSHARLMPAGPVVTERAALLQLSWRRPSGGRAL